MVPKSKRGYELTLSVLKKADVDALIGVLERALAEPDAAFRRRTEEFLGSLESEAVDRFLVRHFGELGSKARQSLLDRPESVLDAARKLAPTGDPHMRANVAEALCELGDRRAVPLLLRYLDDPSAAVRERGRNLLHVLCRRYGAQIASSGGKERAYLRTGLGIALRNGNIPQEALRTVLLLGEEGFNLLLPLLRDTGSEVCRRIVRFLREQDTREVVDCLFFLATTEFEPTRRLARSVLKERRGGAFYVAAGEAVAALGEDQIMALFVSLRSMAWEELGREELRKLSERTQLRLVELLNSFGGPPGLRVKKIGTFFKSRFASVRAEVLEILREVPSRDLFDYLVPLLDDPSEAIAFRATGLLDLQCKPEALGVLIKQLNHPSKRVRERAGEKLSGRSFPLLSRRWEQLGEGLRKRILSTLVKVDQRLPRQLQSELESGDGMRALRALSMLRALEDPSPYTGVVSELTLFPDPYVRATAVSVLGKIGNSTAGKALERLLEDSDPRVLSNTIEALSKMGDVSLVPRLRFFLAHWHNRVRATAVVSLWRLGAGEVRGAVEGMLSHSDSRMRASGQWASGQLREHAMGADVRKREIGSRTQAPQKELEGSAVG